MWIKACNTYEQIFNAGISEEEKNHKHFRRKHEETKDISFGSGITVFEPLYSTVVQVVTLLYCVTSTGHNKKK